MEAGGEFQHTKPSELLTVQAARLAERLEPSVREFLAASDQKLGDLELAAERQSQELLRAAAEKEAQQKADLVPPHCPVCQRPLSNVSTGMREPLRPVFGVITLWRTRGYCKCCKKWLEMFWRWDRWDRLFPHNRHFDPSKN